MDAKEKLALQPKGSKAENWIIKKESNQHEVQQLKNKMMNKLKKRYESIPNEERIKFDEYSELHESLLPLKQDIESIGFKLNTQMLSKVKTQFLNKAKNNSHREKLEKYFDALESAIDGNQKLDTKISLIGTRTHRITTKNFNVQGLPKEVKQLILPTQFNKVFMIDFKAFEPYVVAYLADDDHLKEELNGSQGIHDTLRKNLTRPESHRKRVS
ncbi:DNA polymerase, partial [Staphylococcus aureus]|uniref:DNA polymerase n=1 Tax=Staphylococcus aureus TaxID=1280 RepID=UPI001F06EB3C